VIQIASLFGTYIVSFLIVLVNAALAQAIHRVSVLFSRKVNCSRLHRFTKTDYILFGSAALCILTSLIYGYRIITAPMTGAPFQVSLVQGNIEQKKKWDPAYSDEIMKIYSDLSTRASMNQPDLIVWPGSAKSSIKQESRIYWEAPSIKNM
jgi:apolipoprotein N-acyltransferase